MSWPWSHDTDGLPDGGAAVKARDGLRRSPGLSASVQEGGQLLRGEVLVVEKVEVGGDRAAQGADVHDPVVDVDHLGDGTGLA